MGKGSRRRPTLISNEEAILRWAVARGELRITDAEFDKRIKEIRTRTGKP